MGVSAPEQVGVGFQPPVLLAYPGMDPPAGYREESYFNRGFLIGGAITLGVTYGAGLIYGASQKFEGGLGTLAIPLLGPWIALGKRNFECDTSVPTTLDPDDAVDAADECQELLIEETKVAVVLFGIGLGQLAGAVITTIGLTDKETRWLRADIGGLDVQFDPLTSPTMAGILASGRF